MNRPFLILLSLFTLCCTIPAAEPPPDFPADRDDTLIAAYLKTYVKPDKTRALSSKNDSVAVAAAWYDTRETMKPTLTRSNGQRFLGFLEGRLKLDVPEEIEKLFLTASLGKRVGFDVEKNPDQWTYRISSEGWSNSGFDEISVVRDVMTLTDSQKSVSLKKDLFPEEFSGEDTTDWTRFGTDADDGGKPFHRSPNAVAGTFSGDVLFIAFVSTDALDGVSTLYCVDTVTKQVMWKTDSIRNGLPGFFVTGDAPNFGVYSEVVATDEVVYVFCVSSLSFSITGFKAKDGKCVFRFSTAYADAWYK